MLSLLTVWLDPSLPARYAQLTYLLSAGYVVYALLLALLAWHADVLLARLSLFTHVVDLTFFSFFMYFAEALPSPFFAYFVFFLVGAALRWQWRGVLWTAAVTLSAFIGLGAYAATSGQDPTFELNAFIIRGVYLAVIAVLLACLGAYERHLWQAAVAEERLHLARDLHDGLLQSLAATALQIDTARRLLDQEPQAARERLLELQGRLTVEQRDLRFLIQQLKAAPLSAPETDFPLATRLEGLGAQIERQWGLSVALRLEPMVAEIPRVLARDLYLIVHEALSNAARHAHATSVCITLSEEDARIHLTVADNGRGFPVHGRYDLASLTAANLGPAALKERIASLGGSLILVSTDGGAHLHITLPLTQSGA